ncbi:ComEC/Rec2 family competence protein [Ramlibacter sp. H39-3-26]|uniref:ComEC/Rec2 family competence protein n=1 Tax=Curvibacter soli TaxID=3031331 RepID=UPI0023DB007D|nr:ComEC/Rec2 family competence protein [Ramlibacter sp. H39-3-26]MDF1485741.1 ComEC/Rec2 family competence protein [Ramlibacter sp. H39-3-26]
MPLATSATADDDPPPAGAWLAPLLGGWAAGTALQLAQPALWPLGWYAALACGGALLVWRVLRGRAAWRLACVALLAAVAAFGACGLRAAMFAGHALEPALEGRDIRVTGIVAAMPQRDEDGVRLRLEVESARESGPGAAPVRLPPLIDLGWYAQEPGGAFDAASAPPPLHAGERWDMAVRLKAPHGARNPHGFDYELWAWEQGVQATGSVRASRRDAAPRMLGDTAWHPVERLRQRVRDAIFARLAPAGAAAAPRMRDAGVVAALVTGDQRAIDRADWEVFRTTGVAHLMSISGLHITMFAWLAALAIGALWRRSARLCLWLPAPVAALAGGVASAAAYALFSGGGVPAQRTICMLAVVALLRALGRRWPWPLVWLLAAAVVLALDPWALMQAGFWLSFVAVGVLFATDSGAATAVNTGAGGRFGLKLRALLREQGVVTVALAPLSVLLFHQVSLVGFVANLVAIPWVTLFVTPLALGGVTWPPLWQAAAWGVQVLGSVLQWLAALPGASWGVPAGPLWMGLAAAVGAVLCAMRLPAPLRALGVPLLLPLLLWQPARPTPGQFDLLAADVGQGSAVVVRTAGHTLLYDAGPRFGRGSDAGQRVLVPLLRALGERVDLLLLSHRDSDHTGGTPAVLAAQPQARTLGSQEADALLAAHGYTHCMAGQHWEWDGVAFDVLHPAPADYAVAQPSNAMSCVLRIASSDGTAALLTGDIEQRQEAQLVAEGAPLAATLLLLPHHGSKSSSSAAFLDAARPRIALAQAGYRNRFGHPAPEVLERLAARGVALADSPHCGAARWSSAAPGAIACERHDAPRYWQHGCAPGLHAVQARNLLC